MHPTLSFLVSLIIFAGSLIGPIILVLKWSSRPKLALIFGLVICFLYLFIMVLIASKLIGASAEARFRPIRGVGYFSLFIGFPILKFVQRRMLRKKKILSQEQIEEVFSKGRPHPTEVVRRAKYLV